MQVQIQICWHIKMGDGVAKEQIWAGQNKGQKYFQDNNFWLRFKDRDW